MPYVDGFVLAVPKDKIEAYKELAQRPARSGWSTARSTMSSASATTCPMAS